MTQQKFASGVTFDPDVLQYLRLLCQEHQRSRSFVINAIVRDHAKGISDKQQSVLKDLAVIKL